MMRRIRGGRADDAGAELNMTPFRRPTAAPEPAPSPAVPVEDADVGISGDPSAQPVEPVRRWQTFGGGGRSAAAAAQWQERTPAVAQDLAVDLVRPPPTRYVIAPAPTSPMAAPAPSPSTVVPAVAPVAVRVPRTLPRGFASRNAAAVAGWAADPSVVGVRPVVFSAGGGVGVSTVVAAVGGFLASVSVSPVLALESTRRPWSSLTRFVTGDTRGMSVTEWQDLRSGHDLDSALSMAPGGASGLRVLHQDSGGFEGDWLTGQLPAAASVIIDGGSLDNPDLAGLLSTWPVAVLVVRADPVGVDAALVTVGHLRASLPAGLDVLMVLSDCGAFGGGTVRAAAKLAGSVGEVLTLPNSAGLREQPIRIDRLDKSVAAVIADITHSVVDRSWRRGNPQSAVPATASSAGDDVGGSTPAIPAVTYQKEN